MLDAPGGRPHDSRATAATEATLNAQFTTGRMHGAVRGGPSRAASGLRVGLCALVLALAACAATPRAARAAAPMRDGPRCRTVRLSDIGWADVTATTALFSDIVQDLGYHPKVTMLSVPVTYESMKQGDIDVFLGNWMPSMAPIIRPSRGRRGR